MGAADWKSDAGLGAGPAAAPAPVDSLGTFDEPTLAETLWAEPYRFQYFAALRVLARLSELNAGDDDEPPGALAAIRFRVHQSLTFPASEIWDVRRLADTSQTEMTVCFFGLTGPQGALPRPYTEHVMQRVRKGDHSLRDFLDMFNHRLLTLFARAGEKYRFYYAYEAAAAQERARRRQGPHKLRGFLLEQRAQLDLFSQLLLDLGGMGTPLLRYKNSDRTAPVPRLDVPDATLRYYSGHLTQRHHCAVSLARMLADYFCVPAEILSFVGQWLQLPREHQTCLQRRSLGTLTASDKPPAEGTCNDPRLGQNTVVGARVWEVQGRFRVRLGPLKFAEFQHFLPVGEKYRQLAHLVRLYVGATFDFDVQPVLIGSEVPWCQLGAKGARAPRLGWTTWLRNREFKRPVSDAIFRVPDEVSMSQ